MRDTADDRKARYDALVSARKLCRRCDGLANASEICDGILDSAEIGPWTCWLGDLHACVMVVGQEWGDQRAFEKQQGRDLPSNATNKMLRRLLASIGVEVPEVGVASCPSGVFLTNAALCFKGQGCQGPVRPEWFELCSGSFLRPQIEIVGPRVVICLGERAYRAVMSAYKLPLSVSFRAAVEGPGTPLGGGPIAFAVYHCGRRILNTHRREEQQVKDWRRIATTLSGAA